MTKRNKNGCVICNDCLVHYSKHKFVDGEYVCPPSPIFTEEECKEIFTVSEECKERMAPYQNRSMIEGTFHIGKKFKRF